MKTLIITTTAIAAISMLPIASMANPIRTIEAGAYEECAQRVFAYSTKVSDVFKECEAEMNAYLSTQERITRKQVEQRTSVETRAPDPEKTVEIAVYEECALRVFAQSTKVSDVFKKCKAEMNAYLAAHNPKVRKKLEQRTKVATRRALTETTLPEINREDES